MSRFSDDFLELPMYFEDRPEEWGLPTLVVHTTQGDKLWFPKVSHDPVRYKGWWTISYSLDGHLPATASVPADIVRYFTIIEPPRPPEETAEVASEPE